MIISLSTMYRERGIIKTLFFIRNYRKKDFLDSYIKVHSMCF